MKSKILAVVLLMASSISLFSCHWFGTSNKPANPETLSGKWHLDSFRVGTDSSMANLLIAMHINDSAGVDLEFKADTLLTYYGNEIDTSFFNYQAGKHQLTFEDLPEYLYSVIKTNDSLMTLQATDSSAYILRKLSSD